MRVPRLHAAPRQRLDRVFADIDQRDVVAIEGGVIIGVDAEALGADRIIFRGERVGNCRVTDEAPYLGAEEFRRRIVGVFIGEQVRIGRRARLRRFYLGSGSGSRRIYGPTARSGVKWQR